LTQNGENRRAGPGGAAAVPDCLRTHSWFAPLALAFALGGCSADLSGFDVANLNPLRANDQRSEDYNYFYRSDRSGNSGRVTAADLVGPDGRCAFDPAPASAPGAPMEEPVAAAPPATAPLNPGSNRALYFTAGPETGRTSASSAAMPPEVRGGPRGIALSMTECQVVSVAGYTDRIEIGANQRGQRAVTLTYMSGPRPGIYRFVDGRLNSMEEVAQPPEQKKPQRPVKTAKAKAKPKPKPPAQ
jgi:hypothetical protein